MNLDDHPTVKHLRAMGPSTAMEPRSPLDAGWLKDLARQVGADDVGLVEIERPSIQSEASRILAQFPGARTLLAFACRMNREPVRSPARSVSNLEFHHVGDRVNEVAHELVAALERDGIGAINPAMGFPMEMSQFPGRVWVVSHKTIAVEAGLGMMGIHRNVIHPRMGNFVLLGTVILEAEATAYDHPLSYNPCLECKLCVAACPVGAIHADGHFDFSSCYTHNYREFMGGFTDWVGLIADSGNAAEYRRKVTDSESASMWQSLSFGANYKAAYCMAVCPAGEDVIAPYLADRRSHVETVVRPLQEKAEAVYVVGGSDAEHHVQARFPHKRARRVHGSLRPRSIHDFLEALPHVFQRRNSAGWSAVYHFLFTGDEVVEATITIQDQTLTVEPGVAGSCQLRLTADSQAWLGFVAKERSLGWEMLRGRIRVKGNLRWLVKFGRCFPS